MSNYNNNDNNKNNQNETIILEKFGKYLLNYIMYLQFCTFFQICICVNIFQAFFVVVLQLIQQKNTFREINCGARTIYVFIVFHRLRKNKHFYTNHTNIHTHTR